MDHDTYVRFVDAHAEGVGCHHDTAFSGEPAFLALVFYIIIQTGMIESGGYAVLDQQFGYLACSFPVTGIDNGAAGHAV